MQTYVVRIYRREAKKPENLIGVVEEVETEKKWEFSSLNELIAVFRGEGEGGLERTTQFRQPQ